MSKGSILVVEDENIVALDLKRRLLKLGYGVVGTASNSTAAMALVEKHVPDLVLMDIRIRGRVDGIETAKAIESLHQIPVIFLTAHSEETTLNRALDSMPYGYLLKPCSERELHANIRVAIAKSRADRQLRQSRMQLGMAMNAGNLSALEFGGNAPSVLLSYNTGGRLADVTDWEALEATIVTEDQRKVREQVELLMAQAGRHVDIDFRVQDPASGRRHLLMFAQSYAGAKENRVVGVLQDITERQQIATHLQQVALAFDIPTDGIALLDTSFRVINANSGFFQLAGVDPSLALQRQPPFICADVIGEHQASQLLLHLEEKGHWAGTVHPVQAHLDVLPRWVWLNITRAPGQGTDPGHYVMLVADIGQTLEVREKLSQMAMYDAVTQLPNRALFLDRLELALTRAKAEETQVALLYLDLDHFKRINDTLGHQVGDFMLRSVADRLRALLNTSDTFCRIGGDEFVVIAEKVESEEQLSGMADSMLSTLDTPMLLGNTEVIPQASIGISMYPAHSSDRDDLIRMADTAMFSAKNSGRRRYAFYSAEMTLATEHYLNREMELRAALQNGEFTLFYQPQYDAKSGKISGLEALIRWQHPELGLLAANEIIPVAEMSDLIVAIGTWVAEEVCRQYRRWRDAGLTLPRLAFNVSPRQLLDSHFTDILSRAMARCQIPRGCLEIEITESCLQESERAILALREVEKSGVTIAIDDFGTGYSCLSSLKSLPIHCLKIDQSFVRDIPHDESGCAIAMAILALGQQLNLKVTAEGIETEEQAAFVRSNNCNDLQGFLFSRPIPAAEIQSLLSGESP